MLQNQFLIASFLGTLMLGINAHAEIEGTKEFTKYLEKALSTSLMTKTGRIGELHVGVKVRTLKPQTKLRNVVDDEINYMANEGGELFRHDGKITNLVDLIDNGAYKLIYKTGTSKQSPQYASDGIKQDLLSILQPEMRPELEGHFNLNDSYGSDLVYLRTYTTASEYDGMEKFFILPRKSLDVVIITINNCGGC